MVISKNFSKKSGSTVVGEMETIPRANAFPEQPGLFAPGVPRMTSFRIAIGLLLLALGGCALGTSISPPDREATNEPTSDMSQVASDSKGQPLPRIRPWGRTREKGSGLAPEARAIERSLGYQ